MKDEHVREDNIKFWAELEDGSEVVRIFAHDFLNVNEVGLDFIGSRLVNFLCKMVFYYQSIDDKRIGSNIS